MFSIDQNITDLKVKERNVFKILYSMNSHPVAMPGYASEEARCYILFFSEGQNLSSFIGLYLPQVDKKFFYRYASNPFPFEGGKDVEDEARAFAEEMGFLLDEINIAGMAAEDRNTWIEEQLIFGYRQPESAEPGEEAEEPIAEPEQEQELPVEPAVPAPSMEAEAEAPAAVEVVFEEPSAPQPTSVSPPQPEAAQQQQEMPQQPYPLQQPLSQGTPVSQPVPIPPVAEHVVEPPVQEHVVEPAEEQPKLKPEPAAPPQPKIPAKKKPPLPPVRSRTSVVAQAEEELPVEVAYEMEAPRSRSLFEEAIKEGVVKPLKPKAVKAPVHSPTGIVTRDKEALARLLASF